ncbi:MAG: hypothetical protein V2A61_00835, partial [Calditrichota bacterium]
REEGRFIIQWSRAVARTSVADITQIFQAILLDPQMHQTPTGDGEIIFQYLEAEVVDRNEGNYATVGIEDWNHFRGLEVTFSNLYAEACAPIEARRAIKFTTARPDPYLGVKHEINNTPLSFALGEIYPIPSIHRPR